MDAKGAITNRVTTKMLGDLANPEPTLLDLSVILPELIATAGMAPFHRPAHTLHRQGEAAPVVEPWRFHMLDAATCRKLLHLLKDWPEKTGKILNMLAACDALLQVTWLPDPGDRTDGGLFAASEENMEHIAAASAAVQNFLSLATARGLKTYWSSGGVLRSPAVFERLGIPTNQILIGAVFVFPDEPRGEVEVMDGKQRSQRSALDAWSRWVELS